MNKLKTSEQPAQDFQTVLSQITAMVPGLTMGMPLYQAHYLILAELIRLNKELEAREESNV